MKRTKLTTLTVVTVAGAATLMAGCQSDGGEAATGESHSSSVGATSPAKSPAADKVATAGDSGHAAKVEKTKAPAQYSATARESDLKRVAGDNSRSAIVQVSSGVWEAATWDAKGNIWFWRTSGHGWHKIGSSRYPTLPGPGGSQTKVASTILPGMQHATYLADGVFTGDSSGNDIAFAATSSGKWGTVAPQGNSLVPTGKPATDNTTPGIWRDARFTGGKLRTTVGNPFTANAGASSYPLISDWKWTSGKFVTSSSNVFVSHTVAAPKPPASNPLHDCPTKLPNGTYFGGVTAAQPAGDAPYSTVAMRFWDPNGGAFCSLQVPANTPVTTPAGTSSGRSWVTVPAWMLETTLKQGAGVTKVYPEQVQAGKSPLVAPGLRSLSPDLGHSNDDSVAAQVVVKGGKVAGIELVDHT